MSQTTNEGYTLWFERQGAGDNLVLTGGFGLVHDQFERVTPLLTDGFSVVNWSWRGAGRSDRALGSAPSIDAWTRDMEAVLDAAGVERAALWGTSTGALVSLRFAARHPERVRALVTYPSFRTDASMRRAYMLFADVVEAFGYDAVTRLVSWVGLPPERLRSEEGLAFERWESQALERNLSVEAWRPVCRAIAETDLTADLERLAAARIPVLLLGGDAGPVGLDAAPVRAQLEEFAARVPGTATHVVEGTGGTYCVLEDPQACADAVRGFLQRCAP